MRAMKDHPGMSLAVIGVVGLVFAGSQLYFGRTRTLDDDNHPLTGAVAKRFAQFDRFDYINSADSNLQLQQPVATVGNGRL